ncbi:MAG: YhbY family RNA-binding protein [Clostridia bacterium]|jgi:RNA-binding protein
MLTGKQRANLRKLANNLDTIIQIGKGNIEQPLIKQVDDALAARELIKVRVLTETSALTPREAADILAEATNSEVIQVIGSRIVLFRRNPEKGKYDEYIN